MQGKFYVVGVGPGDPQLITMKAATILKQSDVWFVPSAFENGGSMALKIVNGLLNSKGKTVLSHRFPMKMVYRGDSPTPEVKSSWQKAAQTIMSYLESGQDVVFPTLGDPAIYSTSFYVLETLQEYGSPFLTEIIPGVSSLGAASAAATVPLCLGDERLSLIPATFGNDQIRELIDMSDVLVFMKVHKVMKSLIALLDEFNLVDNAVLVERCSLEEQRVWTNIRDVVDLDLHYFSTMVVRKGNV